MGLSELESSQGNSAPEGNLGLGAVLANLPKEPLMWLLLAVPISVVLRVQGVTGLALFIFACLAIIPLAGLMGRATESLAETMGAGIGGLLNATFGNAAELIIALMALWKGPEYYPLVKASLTGSIIGNLLLVLGLSLLAGGVFHKRMKFNATAASMGATLMALAGVGLLIPSLYEYAALADHPNHEVVVSLSEEICVILAIVYALSLVFTLGTHGHLFTGEEDSPEDAAGHLPEWSRATALTMLVGATVGVAFIAEFLILSVEEACTALHMSHVFVGVIVVAIVGNAAEHSTAVLMAMKNKCDLAIHIAIGSSLQIALFVAPAVVLGSVLINGADRALDLQFTLLEVLALVISILVTCLVCNDGESHWMEGVMLLAVYVMIALAFYNLPVEPHTAAAAVTAPHP